MNIPKGSERGQRGTWWPTQDGAARSAVVFCPMCGKPFSLHKHTIQGDGHVGPSVVCPWEDKPECPGCRYHEVMTLESWSDHAKESERVKS